MDHGLKSYMDEHPESDACTLEGWLATSRAMLSPSGPRSQPVILNHPPFPSFFLFQFYRSQQSFSDFPKVLQLQSLGFLWG